MAKSTIPEAVKWFTFATDYWDEQRRREEDDLACQKPGGLWDKDARDMRSAKAVGTMIVPARPMLSISTLDEPVALVKAQERQAHLGVTIHPLSEEATDETARVLQGLYRACERDSRAHNVRSWGFDRALKTGFGAYRLNKVYDPEGGHPFDQKLLFQRILFQGSVVFSPFAQEPDFSDGMRCMVVSDIPLDVHKARWPKASLSSLSNTEFQSRANNIPEGWQAGDSDANRTLRVCEDWRVELEILTWVLLTSGEVKRKDQLEDGDEIETDPEKAQSRDEEIRHVYFRVINGVEELEPEQEWDGCYIPIIPCIGQELQPIAGKRIWQGMYAPAKDAARLTNYAASGAVEMAALEPKAPWLAEEGVDEGFEEEYRQSNIRNIPVIHYKGRTLLGDKSTRPERVQVDVSRLGPSMELLRMGKDFVQSATSTYDPALGKQPTAHRSGRAIVALQDQTVAGNSGYIDNLANISMLYESRVWLDLAPKVYDRPGRIARILDEDDIASMVMLNQPHTIDAQTHKATAYQGQETPPPANVKHYDLSKGRYGVSVTIGKSSDSRRQEGETEIGRILEADPALMPIIGPEYFKFRDFPGARKIADLLQKMRDHQMPWLADNPALAAVDPARLIAENQALKQQLAEAAKIIETKQVEAQGKFATAHMQESHEDARAAMDREVKLAVAEITALKDRITFMEERQRVGLQMAHETNQASLDRAHESAMAAQDAQHAQEASTQEHQQALVQGEQAQAHAAETQAMQPQGDGGTD